MSTTQLTLEDVTARHEKIVGDLRRTSESIAEELLRFDKRDTARIRKAVLDLDEQVRGFFREFPILTAAQMQARAKGRAEGDEGPGIDSQEWAALMAQVNLTRLAINRWREIRVIVEVQAEIDRSPLYRPDTINADIVDTQMHEVSLLVTRLTKHLNSVEQDTDSHGAGAFPDIPLPHAQFLAHVHAAYRLRLAQDPQGPSYFIDVGCGGAMKVFQAGRFFDRALGIDLDPGYIASAQKFLDGVDQDNAQALQHDALTFPSYGDFHVIYFYRPIRKRDLLTELEHKIVAEAQHGAILIAPYDFFPPVAARLGLNAVSKAIYIKGYTEEQVAELVGRAEQTGPMIRPPLPPMMHVWEPILRASSRRGYGLSI